MFKVWEKISLSEFLVNEEFKKNSETDKAYEIL